MDHGSRTHRKYAASAMARNMRCTASPGACASAPRLERASAQEGTRAHEVLEHCLRTGYDARQGFAQVHGAVEEANAEAVQVALDHVREIVGQYGAGDVVVWLEAAFDVVPDVCGGTSDIIIYVKSLRRLYVIDYKNGWEIVEVADDGWLNEQALTYGLGAVKALSPTYPIDEVVLTIIQPHPWHVDGPVRSYKASVSEVLAFETRVMRMIHEAETRPSYRPGKSTCRWCAAKPFCPAVEQAVAASFGVTKLTDITAEVLGPASPQDVGRLAALLALEPLVKDFFRSITEVATEIHKHGQPIPGKKLVQSQTRREYYGDEKDIAEGVTAIAPNIRAEELFEQKLKPITTVEKMIAQRVRALSPNRKEQSALVADANRAFAYLLDKKGSGKLVLADWDDNRPEVKVADMFGDVKLPVIEGPKA